MNSSTLYVGDCLSVLPQIDSGSVQCVYLDPPFRTQKTHCLKSRDRTHSFSFDDIWACDQDYAEFLHKRLQELHRVPARTGSIFFHCDRNAMHIARALLDEVFGSDQFRAEIIWTYRRWSNGRRGLLPAHQTIYHYTKSDQYKFNRIWEEYSPSTNVDQILQQRTRDRHGKAVYKRGEDGAIVAHGEKKGVPLADVWDIPYLNPKARERVGYPTQKPLLLLERILRISTDEEDLVLDPFCGSGTTLVAGEYLGRRAIGIDVSREAVELAVQRLRNPVRSDSDIVRRGREAFRCGDEEALALLRGVSYVPVHRNRGIDAILSIDSGGGPVTVRVQRQGETIAEAAGLLYEASAAKSPRAMVLIAVSRGGSLFTGGLPPDVLVIDAPAIQIQERLREVLEATAER